MKLICFVQNIHFLSHFYLSGILKRKERITVISGVNQKVNTVVSLEMNMFRFNHVNKNNGVPKKMCLTCIRKVCVCSIVLSNESKNPKISNDNNK